MREVTLHPPIGDVETESFRAAIATVLELPLEAVPPLEDARAPARNWHVSRWLGGMGLGLVQVADARTFAWAGPWIARVSPAAGCSHYVVMYGVPSGVVFDPTGGDVHDGSVVEGFVPAAADIALARPRLPTPTQTVGRLEEIWVASAAGVPLQRREVVPAIAGGGLEGDRHTLGTGTFPSGLPGSALTLIEAEVCETFAPALRADEHRRNLVTRGVDLNSLVGSRFTIGSLHCRGMRLCEPCTVIDGYASRPVLRALVHRGGLRADILADAEIKVGDAIQAVAELSESSQVLPRDEA